MDKIICVGRNYEEHVNEMVKIAGDAKSGKPVLFLKPPSSIFYLSAGNTSTPANIELPFHRGAVHFECEMVFRLKASKNTLTPAQAENHISAVALGLDLTLRDLQTEIKKAGKPWDIAKVFKNSAIVSPFTQITDYKQILDYVFSFERDGRTLQNASPSQMILKPNECVAYASEFFEICDGDLLFTGTPSGVGPLDTSSEYTLNLKNELKWKVKFH